MMITLITIMITFNCSESSKYICIYSIYIYNRNEFSNLHLYHIKKEGTMANTSVNVFENVVCRRRTIII